MIPFIFRFKNLFARLVPLTELDPLFLYGLVYVCPKNEYNILIHKMPLFLPIAFRAKQLEENGSLHITEVAHIIFILINR